MPGHGVLSNIDGDFTMTVERTDSLHFSFIGYEPQHFPADKLPKVVKMKERVRSLNEVTVLGNEGLLAKVQKKLKKDYRKGRRQQAHYFNRISVIYGQRQEMVEDFLEAQSAVNLRRLKVNSGQYWASDSPLQQEGWETIHSPSLWVRSNLHKLFSLGPMVQDDKFWSWVIFPLPSSASPKHWKKYYKVTNQTLYDDDGRRIYRIEMQRKDLKENAILNGTLYVDAVDYRILRFDGTINHLVMFMKLADNSHDYIPMDVSLHVDYRHDQGFAEVENMTLRMVSEDLEVTGTLIDVEDYNLPMSWGVEIKNNILQSINEAGYNADLAAEYDFVQRTKDEEALVSRQSQPATEHIPALTADSTLVTQLTQEVQKQNLTDSLPSDDPTTVLSYIKHAMRFSLVRPSEKVYLHIDNTGYFEGETIWFKAYVIRTDTEDRTDLSRILYVELLDPTGEVVERRKLPIAGGMASGDIRLDSLMLTGYYELRAYTRYLTNWGTHACFSRVIPIFKTPRKAGDYSHPQMDEFDTRHRLPNVRTDFSILPQSPPQNPPHRGGVRGGPEGGLGQCSLTLNMLRSDSVTADIQTTPALHGRMLGYVLMHGGRILHCDTLLAGPPPRHLAWNRRAMPAGVSQLTVFDSHGNICADRLFFIPPQPTPADSIHITVPTEIIRPCGKVELTLHGPPRATLSLSVTDAATTLNGRTSGDIHTWMHLSSEVQGYIHHPERYFEADDSLHRQAAAGLMMAQGWRRYNWKQMTEQIPLPQSQPIETRQLIQGKILPKKKKQTPLADITLQTILYNAQGQALSGITTTDSLGAYILGLPEITGRWNLQILTQKDSLPVDYLVGIDRHFSPPSRTLSPAECQTYPIDTAAIFHWESEEAQPVLMSRSDHLLQEVTVKAKRRWTETHRWGDEHDARRCSHIRYDCDEAVDQFIDEGKPLPSFCEWLKQRNSFFSGNLTPQSTIIIYPDSANPSRHIAKPYHEFDPLYEKNYDIDPRAEDLLVYDDGLSYKNRPLVWVVDNMFFTITNYRLTSLSRSPLFITNDHNNSMLAPPVELDWVKSVYISEDLEALHKHVHSEALDRMNPVVLYVFTHRTTTGQPKGYRRTYYQGYDPPATFQMDDYSVLPPMEDFRRTLYWNPNLTTDRYGKVNVTFYNNSSCTDMLISVEGMSADGHPLRYAP